MSDSDLRRGPVCIDDLVTVQAVYDRQERWNGFLCPRMDRDAVETVMAAFGPDDGVSDPRPPSHHWDGDVLPLTQYDGDDEYNETLMPDADGLYALGAREWVWSEDGDSWPLDDERDAEVVNLDDRRGGK
jgi:hypothetical protein